MNGGIGKPPPGGKAGSIIYAQGPDIQTLLHQAVALGSAVIQPVMEIPEMVTYATFDDPWGTGSA